MLILREVPRRAVRLSAGLASAETTTALAIAHTAAGGVLPSAGWLLAIAATTYGASVLVLRGRVPVRVMVPALVGLQILLHAWLVALTAGSGLHEHGAEAAASFVGLSWPMLLAHGGAGLVAALVWLVRRRAVDVLLGWVDQPAPPVPFRAAAVVRRALPNPARRDLSAVPTRGPPVAFGATA